MIYTTLDEESDLSHMDIYIGRRDQSSLVMCAYLGGSGPFGVYDYTFDRVFSPYFVLSDTDWI